MVTTILLIQWPDTYNVSPIFWLESIWLVAFGVACLLRGTTASNVPVPIAKVSRERHEESGTGGAGRQTGGGEGVRQHDTAADRAEPGTGSDQAKPPDPSQDPTKPGRQ